MTQHEEDSNCRMCGAKGGIWHRTEDDCSLERKTSLDERRVIALESIAVALAKYGKDAQSASVREQEGRSLVVKEALRWDRLDLGIWKDMTREEIVLASERFGWWGHSYEWMNDARKK